jgi:hypothetical protein
MKIFTAWHEIHNPVTRKSAQIARRVRLFAQFFALPSQ